MDLDFATCYQLYRLFLTLPPVLDSAAWCLLCCLFSAFMPVLGFVAYPQLCRLSSTFSPVLGFGACCRLYYMFWSLPPGISYCISYCVLLQHLSYTSDTILPGLGTAHASWPSAKLRT